MRGQRLRRILSDHPVLFNGVVLVWIATLCAVPLLAPNRFLGALGLAGQPGFTSVVLVCATASACGYGLAALLILRHVFRRALSLRHLAASTRATVTVEFLLAFPALMLMFGTIFAVAEISHAQLMFRYAAFSAARAGAISNYTVKGPPVPPDVFSLSTTDRNRMRAAAVTVLAALDGHDFGITSPPSWLSSAGLGSGETVLNQLSTLYMNASPKFPLLWRYLTKPWVSSAFFTRQFNNADQALVSFEPSFVASGAFVPGNLKVNYVAPPLVQLSMSYELRLRPISIFWLICPNGKGGYPCITLARVASYDSATPLAMQTSGSRIDMPWVPPLDPLPSGISFAPGDLED